MVFSIFFLLANALEVDYRFGIDYGDIFFDYSGNKNHAINKQRADLQKVLKTDRGIYTESQYSCLESTNKLRDINEYSVSIWLMPTDNNVRIFFFYLNFENRIVIGRDENNELYVFVKTAGNLFMRAISAEKMSLNYWHLITLQYTNYTYKLCMNSKIFIQFDFIPIDVTMYGFGIGTPNTNGNTAIKAFYWRLTISSILSIPEKIEYEADASTCLARACDIYSFCIDDPSLGNICLSNSSDPNVDSYEEFNGIGTKTLDFICSSQSSICTYNPILNMCYSFDLDTGYNQTIDCKCKEGYLNINHQCCQSDCCSCNMRGICKKYLNSMTRIVNDSCECFQGSFEEDLSDQFCESCSKWCKKCNNKNSCEECFDGFVYTELEKCTCPNKTYLNNDSLCEPCHQDCLNCNETGCLECIAKNSSPNLNLGCQCNEGFWNESFLTHSSSCLACNETCKSCINSKTCINCKDPDALNIEGKCLVYCNLSRIENCTRCEDACRFCYENLTCYNCTEHSTLIDGKCICDKGWQLQGSICTEKYFYCEIQTNKYNKILLNFSEVLDTSNLKDKIILKVRSNEHEIKVLKRNINTYYIIPDPPVVVQKKVSFEIIFNNKIIYSKLNSKLFNSSFNDYFHIQSITEAFENSQSIKITQSAGVAVASISFASNPTGLWALLNTIQLISFMPLNSVDYPQTLKEISNGFFNYNILPNIFANYLDPNSTNPPYKHALELGISTSVVFINIGRNVTILGLLIIFILVLRIIVKFFIQKDKLKTLYTKTKFNLLLSFFLQTYLELGIYSAIQIHSVKAI